MNIFETVFFLFISNSFKVKITHPVARKQIVSTFKSFQAVLSMAPEGAVRPRHKSGAYNLHRPISKGTEEFPTSKSVYPLTQPIPKIEALAQASGNVSLK